MVGARSGDLAPGTFGENLTTAGPRPGAPAASATAGACGTAVLEVAQPRQPCFKLGIRMGDDGFPERFAEAGRPGAYLRIVAPGDVGTGDEIEVHAAEPPAVPIGALVADPIDDDVLRLAATDPRVPDGWRRTAARSLAR